jgi:hypothetical protein
VSEDRDAWRDRRVDAARAQAEAHQRRRSAEHERARALLRDFVAEARERGLEPVPLQARAWSGRGRFRTDVTGWYLRRNGSLGVGTDGEFYVLGVPGGLRERLLGVRLQPTDPPLVVGAGGRDGESVPLADLLRARLDAADDGD